MADAKKCDRCGNYYDENAKHKVTINSCKTVISEVCTYTRSGHAYKPYDLCDNCIDDFFEFMCNRQLEKED